MVRLPAIHSGRSSAALSTRYDSRPRLRATSRSRFELELLGEPTTITTSHLGAITLTASWRFWVA